MEPVNIAAMSTADKLDFLHSIVNAESVWKYQEELATLIVDADPEVRKQALDSFWEWDSADPAMINALTRAAGEDSSAEARIAAISALGRYIYEGFVMEELIEEDYEQVQECLLDLFHDHDEPLDVRRSAVESLGFITDPEIEEVIREAYADERTKMRISAIFAMGRSGTRTWDDILLGEMKNPDPEVRFEAVRAAGETFMSRAADLLEKLTEDPDRTIRIEAILSLGKAGRPNSRQTLRRLLASPDEDIRDAAALALEELDLYDSEYDPDTAGE